MKTVSTIELVRRSIAKAKAAGNTIGLVPTMGALHEGHYSLIRRCQQECDFVVVSIFLNPTQFGPGEDITAYPRNIEADCLGCDNLGVDLVFTPSADEMYSNGNLTWVNVETITEHLCGASRPGHFRGVCTVVAKLFNIVLPDVAYFGQKDAQQLAVIRRMVADMNMPVRIVGCPIVREPDGLAMSSRNEYLSAAERSVAVCLWQGLSHARELFTKGQRDAGVLCEAIREIVERGKGCEIDYISIVDNELLSPISQKIDCEALIAIAVRIGKTRLIDNIMVCPIGQ